MLFTIPFNNTNPDEFLRTFDPYKEHIHSFYFGMPGIFECHNPSQYGAGRLLTESANVYRFLELTKGKYKTILCLNTLAYPMSYERLQFHLIRELSMLVEMGLYGVNVASPSVARVIHESFPDVDIQTSCNTYTFITNMYRHWHEEFGATVFNLPREALRTPWALEQFRETGFVSKCLVNEGCIYGCPGNVEHACSFIMSHVGLVTYCDHCKMHLSDVFKSNFIPPHRLSLLEKYIDIAKIAGRSFTTEKILKVFLAYLHGDPNAKIDDIMHSRMRKMLTDNNLMIYAKEWPKKTLTCECKECKTCNICQKAMEHVVARNGVDPSTLSHPI